MAASVRCPTCGVQVAWTQASAWRPFCSQRCKSIDLGAWASDAYVVPGAPLADDDEDKLPDGPGLG